MHAWCRSSCEQLGISVAARGLENLVDGPAVLVANHQSVLDILVLGSLFDHDYRWVAKRSLFKIPFLGWHLALQGHIPVDRSRAGNQERLDAACQRAFEVGAQVLIFPEGTRSQDAVLQPFRMGAFVLAEKNCVPIIPITLSGTAGLMQKGAWTLDEGESRNAYVDVLPPIRPYGAGKKRSAELLRSLTYDVMQRAFADAPLLAA